MLRVVVDSNILIGVLNGTIPVTFFDEVDQAFVCAMTVLELYALSGTSEDEDRRIAVLLASMNVVTITERIAKRAGIMSRTVKSGKADLLIAATALELGLPLITKNLRDFKRIQGLEVRSIL